MENQLLEQSTVPDGAEKAGHPAENHPGNELGVQIPGPRHRSPWSSGAGAARESDVPKASWETVVSPELEPHPGCG